LENSVLKTAASGPEYAVNGASYARRKAWLAADAASPFVELRGGTIKRFAVTLGRTGKPNGKHRLTAFPRNFIFSSKILG
jgi:hypothetical protein